MKDWLRLSNWTKNKHLYGICFFCLILNFIFLVVLISEVNMIHISSISLLGLEFEQSAFCGLLTELLIINMTLLTLFFDKRGFQASSVLFVMYICYTLIVALRFNEGNSFTGLIMIVFCYFICGIIYHTFRNLKQNYELVKQQKCTLNQIAFYDSLTSLPNRHRILSEINTLIAQSKEKNQSFSIIRLDIANYRLIRDYLGHIKGEEELRLFSDRLKTVVHPLDMPGRLDNNEFIILVDRPLNNVELKEYALNLQQGMSHMIICNQNHFYFTTNLGICTYPDHGSNMEQLLQYADTACFEAKKDQDHHICFFDHSLYERLAYKAQIENALKDAVVNDELYLVFQPQYSSTEKKLRGFETLLRWSNPEMGLISPATFIPIAEKTGSILPIGKWVLENACTTFYEIIRRFDITPMLSVNISAVQLLESSFLDTMKEVLKKTGFPAELLEIEITETVLISSKETVIRVLNELKEMGIHIALDDFGTEYASLSYLQQLPLDILKIDKSFIGHIGQENQQDMVESIITIAKQQSLTTVAEGIETEQQLAFLKEKGCQYIQGFLWGKPIPKENIIELLSNLKETNNMI